MACYFSEFSITGSCKVHTSLTFQNKTVTDFYIHYKNAVREFIENELPNSNPVCL